MVSGGTNGGSGSRKLMKEFPTENFKDLFVPIPA
jgi:hypothetical protein